jgi:mannan endo-1,4-beta-mannosidase
VFNENLLVGLDFLLVELKKRDMVAVMCLNNFWPWSGGFAQYVSWANANETIP